MPKKLYGRVKMNGSYTYRKLSPIYCNPMFPAPGPAREVVKAYCNVNGVARQCYSAYAELIYYGSSEDGAIEKLKYEHNITYSGAAAVGPYVLICDRYGRVDVYDDQLNHTTASIPGFGDGAVKAASTANHAIFLEGPKNGQHGRKRVWTFDKELVLQKVSEDGLPRTAAAATFGKYAVFAGAYGACAYDDNLVKLPLGFENTYDVGYSAAVTGNWISFVAEDSIRRFDSNFVQRSCPSGFKNISGKVSLAAAGQYVIIAGALAWGSSSYVRSAKAQALDQNGVLVQVASLSKAKSHMAAVSAGDYAIFAGGSYSPDDSDVVEVYDRNLVKTSGHKLCIARNQSICVRFGDQILIAGGSSYRNPACGHAADIYQILDRD